MDLGKVQRIHRVEPTRIPVPERKPVPTRKEEKVGAGK